MPARLSRKRYTEISRYLKAVIGDPNKPDRLRMTAVESLLEVYARHDRSEVQREQRRRATEGTQAGTQAPPQPEDVPRLLYCPPAPPAQEAYQESLNAVDAFLEKIRPGKETHQ